MSYFIKVVLLFGFLMQSIHADNINENVDFKIGLINSNYNQNNIAHLGLTKNFIHKQNFGNFNFGLAINLDLYSLNEDPLPYYVDILGKVVHTYGKLQSKLGVGLSFATSKEIERVGPLITNDYIWTFKKYKLGAGFDYSQFMKDNQIIHTLKTNFIINFSL
jgi:hypothetical protein